jgi:hypothetical protein
MKPTHGLKLLQLVGSENAGELGSRLLMDGAELLTALIVRESGVGAKGGDLLLLRGQNGLELRGLVAGEVEALAEMLRGLVRIEAVVMVAVVRCRLLCRGIVGRLSGGLLGEGRRSGEGKCQGGSEK